jgi:hypothetical protein
LVPSSETEGMEEEPERRSRARAELPRFDYPSTILCLSHLYPKLNEGSSKVNGRFLHVPHLLSCSGPNVGYDPTASIPRRKRPTVSCALRRYNSRYNTVPKTSLPGRKLFLSNRCRAGTTCSRFLSRRRAAAASNVRSPDSFLLRKDMKNIAWHARVGVSTWKMQTPKGKAERPLFRISCTKSAPRKREAPASSASMGRRYVKRIIAAAQPVKHLRASGSRITPTHE